MKRVSGVLLLWITGAVCSAQTAPTIVSYQATPAGITSGASSTLSWQVNGAISVQISSIGTVNPTSGSVTVSPTATTTYTLTATNARGTSTATASVSVFTATPANILVGQSSTLTWEVIGAAAVSISPGIGNVPPKGSVVVTPLVTTTYVLKATNAGGSVAVTIAATVTVAAASPTVSIAPAVLPFYDVMPGQTKMLSAAVSANASAAFDVALTIYPDAGTPQGVFTLAATNVFASSQPTNVPITFSPPKAGVYSATLLAQGITNTATMRVYGGGADSSGMSIAGISNSADRSTALAPDSWIEIYGQNMAATTRAWTDADFVNGQEPTTLDGVSVSVNGEPAYIAYVSPTQVNILTPPDATIPSVSNLVVSLGAQKTNLAVVPGRVAITFFVWGSDPKNYVAATRPDGTYVGPPGALGPSVNVTRAVPGDTLAFYLAGLGPDPAAKAGQVGQFALSSLPTLSLGSISANALYAVRIAPGLYQVGFNVPSVAAGDYAIRCEYQGAFTVSAFTLSVGAVNTP